MNREEEIARLRAARPRDRFVRLSLMVFALLLASVWFTGEFAMASFDWDRRVANCQRFLGQVLPFPVQQAEDATFSEKLSLGAGWFSEQWQLHGAQAFRYTLGLSVVAIVLAGIASLVSLPLASRRLAVASPYLPSPSVESRWRAFWWSVSRRGFRFLLILARSIPEYMIAFFLVVALGFNAWPAVLALAIHNAGILGRLGSELVDNQASAGLAEQRSLGASRLQIFAFGAVPNAFSRFLLFFFYRWETCVRDATVLGMLGIPTFGYYLLEARAKDHLDEMLFFVLLGSIAVLLGDLVSTVLRWRLRGNA